jgi:hypothetical protein
VLPGPTELTAFSDRHEEFKKIGAEVLGVSVDSQFTHLAWIQTDRKEGEFVGMLRVAGYGGRVSCRRVRRADASSVTAAAGVGAGGSTCIRRHLCPIRVCA